MFFSVVRPVCKDLQVKYSTQVITVDQPSILRFFEKIVWLEWRNGLVWENLVATRPRVQPLHTTTKYHTLHTFLVVTEVAPTSFI